ncbi:MAG: hypothetical protein AAGE52_02335 [Myxococcota bacterium]
MNVRLALVLALATACETGGLPQGLAETQPGSGPRILWDLNGEPLPELPLPNDAATWPDPTSPTGRRLNVSVIAPTFFEELTRTLFDEVDGWGTFGTVSIPFDAPIDTRDLFDRQGGGSAAFAEDRWPDHGVYVINLETGEPVPLDANSGNFHYVLDKPSQFWRNDPKAGESNILFETNAEDLNDNGILDPGEDVDFDGVLDVPNTWDGTVQGPLDTVDEMTWFWERESNTLLLRPILPMEPRTEYAVVVTDRVRGEDGQAVRSPFDIVHPITQRDSLERLPEHFSNRPEIYGDLATRGWEGVAFAWTFTTQSTYHDLDAIRAGMYGEGPFQHLNTDFPTDYAPSPMQGGRRCTFDGSVLVAPAEPFREALSNVAGLALGLDEAQTEFVVNSYDNLSHVVVTFFDTPFFLGDPHTTGLEDTFQINAQTGEGRIDRETISMIMFIPKETETSQQPYDVAFYVHGHGSASAEPLPFAGFMLQHGVAAAMINAEGHGVPIDGALAGIVEGLFDGNCIAPAANAILNGRAEDLTNNGELDSGGDFWTAYLFHTRDVVRQTVVDHMRSLQILRSFDGRTANAVNFLDGPMGEELGYNADIFDYEGPDIAGDFDGDGVPDVGGPDAGYFFTGGSLGGIITGIMGGVEPSLRAAAPIVGAGGLSDVATRIDLGGVLSAMHMRMMGPFVITAPMEERRADRTSCAPGEISVYLFLSNVLSRAEVEIACLPADALDDNDTLLVRNADHDELACTGATGGSAGNYRIAYAADAGDELSIEIYSDARDITDFEHCTIEGDPSPSRVIDRFEVTASFQGTTYYGPDSVDEEGNAVPQDRLVSPTMGLGNDRQRPDLRRLLFLAQSGLEPADPINYARRVFLDPVGTSDAPAEPTNLLVVNSIGDQSVPLSTGNAYARAAGVLPFMPPDAPEFFAEWRAPAWFEGRYPGLVSPNDVLIEYHVLEGVDRLERHPVEGAATFLFDVDDISEGRLQFTADGNGQSMEDTAIQAPRLDPPLRWVRQSRSMANAEGDVWQVTPGSDASGLINNYAIPDGVHGFDQLVYDQALPWDPAQYLINLIARWGAANGQDIRYVTDPDNHQCLEDSTCEFLENDQ